PPRQRRGLRSRLPAPGEHLPWASAESGDVAARLEPTGPPPGNGWLTRAPAASWQYLRRQLGAATRRESPTTAGLLRSLSAFVQHHGLPGSGGCVVEQCPSSLG